MAVPVEFAVRREGDMVDIEIEPHADRIGRDDVVDIAGLEQLDLGVAGAGRQGAEDDGGAALLPAHQLGDRIDLLGREGDDRRARRQARDLLLAGEGELREPGARHDIDAREQALDQGARDRGADDQGLLDAARMQQPVGEDMPAVEIGRELDLVDGDEGNLDVARHRLDGGDPVARLLRLDLLLAGDERDGVGARLARPRGHRPRAPGAAAAGRSRPPHAPACARPRDGSCRYWSGPRTAVTPFARSARAKRLKIIVIGAFQGIRRVMQLCVKSIKRANARLSSRRPQVGRAAHRNQALAPCHRAGASIAAEHRGRRMRRRAQLRRANGLSRRAASPR